MPMKPGKNESKDDFISRCASEMSGKHPDWSNDQVVAACFSMWSENKDAGGVVHKTKDDALHGLDFILSDESPDRYGDIIVQDGWDLANFKRNPIALFNHNKNAPIGTWENLKVVGGELRARLKLAPEGTSPRIDEIRKLIEAGILKATSVGFLPLESRPRKEAEYGYFYTKAELIETSLVSIPANPNALAVAKSLGISDATRDLIFAKHGEKDGMRTRQLNGEHARSTENRNSQMSLAQRIEESQTRIASMKEQLAKHIDCLPEEPDEAQNTITTELSSRIKKQQETLDGWLAAEAQLASTAQPVVPQQRGAPSNLPAVQQRPGQIQLPGVHRPFAQPEKKKTSFDHMISALTMRCRHAWAGREEPLFDMIKREYGEGDDKTLAWASYMITKAATVPAATTTAGWAAELVTTGIAEFLEALLPVSIYGALAIKGATFSFGRDGVVSIPSRLSTPTLAGGFTLQGAPIAVKQAAFTAITLTPKYVKVITTLTREMAQHSNPQLEGILRQAIIDDTATAVDTTLLDAVAADATRPAGILNGVAKTPAVAGGGITSLIGDLKGLVQALITGTSGRLRAPVWIMSPGDLITIGYTQAAAGGDMPFKEEAARGMFGGIPVIQSTSVTADTMIILDAADFVTATGDAPEFVVSDQATLHMEDTTPLAIGTAGTPNTVAAPVRSLFQTDSMAIRMVMPMNWAFRRTGMIAWTDTMLWN